MRCRAATPTACSCSPVRAGTSAREPTSAATLRCHQLAHMRFYGLVALALHQLPQPAIAKIRGVAVGAGLNLALGCDLIATAPSARLSETPRAWPRP
ncbi:MAG: hypothetical protein E6J87_23165 [Deltaproteobacteria bacterium]|nr:MAG: hypothetical protein E6J87_23165 [Deltaproteobacteria bacterium]